jgi:hypothetical protein
MSRNRSGSRRSRRTVLASTVVALASSVTVLAVGGTAYAAPALTSGDLLVSTSVWQQNANITAGTTQLPPNCGTLADDPCATAVAPGTYPLVFNNDSIDASFGVTQPIVLDELNPSTNSVVTSVTVPNSSQGLGSSADQMVTSFSSKSEIALNQSTDDNYVTFMGYVAPVGAIDASNSNTPGAVDPTNSAGTTPYYRAVAQLDDNSNFSFTETNAYSGNNGRAAILNNSNGADFIYTAGNAGDGANPQPTGVVLGAGAQFIVPSSAPESFQNVMAPTPLASFSVTLLGDKADKIGKDDNFRGLTIFNNVVYFTKGSGSNGVDTVYFVDTTGIACPKGVGVPAVGAPLPISPLPVNLSTLQTAGLSNNMCILAGFPTVLAKTATAPAAPFGLFFANADTLYVADEGDGFSSDTTLYTHAAAQTTAGLQKWVFNDTTQTWSLAYTLQTDLGLGTPYTVNKYPTGNNPATNLPWSPATDGLRNITGTVDGGTATIYAITSTISGNGDTGADPNRLVAITDKVDNTDTTKAAKEKFTIVRKADFAEVLRGVSFTPGTK